MIRFFLDDELVELDECEADLTVLNFLRENRSLTGTKEGCASGDCGACTVVLAELKNDQQSLHYRAINSCITFMSALNGKQLITVEHLATNSKTSGQQLHPVQQAMVDHHGSQCGFCTPGFIMSLFALYHNAESVTRPDVITALSGNLCRCTGYRPIIDAALDACNQTSDDQFTSRTQTTIGQLKELANEQDAGTSTLLIPLNRAELTKALADYPNARLVAGATDLALESTQQLKPLSHLISVSQVAELRRIKQSESSLTIGAACPLGDIAPKLTNCFPALKELIERFASVPVRNQATLGGNVANASPIGDMPPVLLALNAHVITDNGSKQRSLPIAEFFTGYRQTQLATDEWIDSIVVPLQTSEANYLRAYKVSKRIEDDISAVCAVFSLVIDNGKVVNLTTGFGGVAATPVKCETLEDAMIGQTWQNPECMEQGQAILLQAFSPIDDVRASAQYRREILASLWHRFWLETNHASQAIQTRAIAHA